MRDIRRGSMLAATIAERRRVQTGKKLFAGSEQDWNNNHVHLVDKASPKVLLNCRDRGDCRPTNPSNCRRAIFLGLARTYCGR
jgi:hypothetical protein